MSLPVARALLALANPPTSCKSAPDWTVVHLHQRFGPSTPDNDWIQEIGSENRWVIVSGDSRILSNKHEAQALLEAGCPAFFLAPPWMNLPARVFFAKLAKSWFDIVETAQTLKSGQLYVVKLNGKIEPTNIKARGLQKKR